MTLSTLLKSEEQWWPQSADYYLMTDRFFDYLRYELNRAPLTVEAYRTDIGQFMEWISPAAPDDTDFLSVTSNDVRAWLAQRAKKGDSPRTLRRKIISLRTLFKWMMKTGVLKKSPLQEVPLPKISKPLPDIVKPQDVETALKNIEETEDDDQKRALDLLIVEILYSLGIRRAELVGLNDSDVDFSSGELKVTGKRSKQRIIPVPQKLMTQIRRWQEIRDKDKATVEKDGPLFVVKGKRITSNQVYQIVHKSLGDSAARKKSPHALRHSFASGMLNGGAEIDSVREFLGHSSLATTQIYTHISFKEIKNAYNRAHPRSTENKN